MKRELTFSQKHDLKTVQVLSEIEVLHYMCDSIKIVSGLLSYLVYFPQKNIFSFVWFMYYPRNVPSEGKIVKHKSPKRQKEDFPVIHNKIGKPVANLLKYLSY